MDLSVVLDDKTEKEIELRERQKLCDFSEKVKLEISEVESSLKQRLIALRQDLENTTEELKIASAQGDHSENAEYTNAVEKIARLTSDMAGVNDQLEELSLVNEEGYTPIGKVVMYSTVKLSYWPNETDEKEQIVFKVYPGNISDIARGILARNSPVGKQVWLKKEGAQFTLSNRRTGKPVRYRIDFIY